MEKLAKEQKRENRAACSKKYREANKEKIAVRGKAYSKAYNKANKEKIVARNKAYKKANKEREAARDKAYHESNKERIAVRNKAYRETNKELILVREKAYREANKEKCSTSNKRYRDKMPCGVYKIQSISDPDKVYVGGSILIPQRWINHLSDLKKGRHKCLRLQAHYDLHGKNDLAFSILMLVDEADLVLAEQAYMDELKPYFNMARATAGVIPDRIFDTVLTIVA